MAKQRLIVCSDGTWNTPDQRRGGEDRPSNVVKMWRAIERLAPGEVRQMKFYDEGVGTDGYELGDVGVFSNGGCRVD